MLNLSRHVERLFCTKPYETVKITKKLESKASEKCWRLTIDFRSAPVVEEEGDQGAEQPHKIHLDMFTSVCCGAVLAKITEDVE